MAFKHILIIYNPISTGNAPALAKRLARSLEKQGFLPDLMPTNHAGHAVEIARTSSLEYDRPLIISVSGDGGYNEVINGALLAKKEKPTVKPVVSVLGAGNANDHYRVMHSKPIEKLIDDDSVHPLDVLSLAAEAPGFSMERYAHSYIGLGITPEVGDELNRHDKNRLSEIRLVLKTLLKFKPFTIINEGRRKTYDSLLFANINEMAKFVTLNEEKNTHDDRFEVIEIPHRGKLALFYTLLKAVLFGFKDSPSCQEYTFTTAQEILVQFDGEVEKLPKGATVTVRSHYAAIDSLH